MKNFYSALRMNLIRSIKIKLKRIQWIILGGYKPKRFWDNWAKTFMDDPWQASLHRQHEWLLEKIYISSPKSILEPGCGFGRNIKFLLDNGFFPEQIVGTDISAVMIHNAKIYLKNKKVKIKKEKVIN